MSDSVTVPAVRGRKGSEPLTMVTAYDFPTARLASEAGIDIVLVGDSVGNVVHGMDDTLGVTVELMEIHAAAVRRARPQSLVVVDMPWMSFHVSPEAAVTNAARLIRAGGEAVKIEGGRRRLPAIERILEAEIPVMGHLGLTPQSVHAMGGYRVQGKAVQAAREMVADARALASAGVFALVLEGVPDVLAEVITREIDVPTIGIGAGGHTDGQVLVMHDLLGLGFGSYPKFVRTYEDLRTRAVEALTNYADDVRSGTFPGDAETYHMREDAAAQLLEAEASDFLASL